MVCEHPSDKRPDNGWQPKDSAEHTEQHWAVLEARSLSHHLYHRYNCCYKKLHVVSETSKVDDAKNAQMPDAPTPLTVRPTMSWCIFCDTPQIKEPVSKMATVVMRIHFAEKMRMAWPQKRRKTVCARTNEVATHPWRVKASKSC